LLRRAAQVSAERGWPMTIHVSESNEEFAMFTTASGPMYDWLKRNSREMSDCGQGSPVAHLARLGCLSERLLAIHVNYLAKGDDQLLAQHHVQVVHCPRSHDYFGHDPFPLHRLDEAGVNISLGTDSLASMRCIRPESIRLSPLDEARGLADKMPGLSPERLLRMITVHPAQALGIGELAGRLAQGSWADLMFVPGSPRLDEAAEAVLAHRGDVGGSMIGGRWVWGPGTDDESLSRRYAVQP
jgi:cytosine/adenosine deaminase-related metal-dependent hydrolase